MVECLLLGSGPAPYSLHPIILKWKKILSYQHLYYAEVCSVSSSTFHSRTKFLKFLREKISYRHLYFAEVCSVSWPPHFKFYSRTKFLKFLWETNILSTSVFCRSFFSVSSSFKFYSRTKFPKFLIGKKYPIDICIWQKLVSSPPQSFIPGLNSLNS